MLRRVAVTSRDRRDDPGGLQEANHVVHMREIPVGTYRLAYMDGLDWDDGEATFRCNPHYAEFERNFMFTEETTSRAFSTTPLL